MKLIKDVWKVICYPLLYMIMVYAVVILYYFWRGYYLTWEYFRDYSVLLSSEELFAMINSKTAEEVCRIIAVLIVFFIINLTKRKEWKEGNFWKVGGSTVSLMLICLLLGISFNFFTEGMLSLTKAVEFFPSYGKVVESFIGGNFVVKVVSIGLLSPLIEEIIFRGIILKYLQKKIKTTAAIITQALLFAFVYLNIVQGFYMFIFGIIAGLVYIYLDSIWAATAVRIGTNLSFVIMLELFGIFEIQRTTDVPITVVGFAAAVGAFIILYRNRTVYVTQENIHIEPPPMV